MPFIVKISPNRSFYIDELFVMFIGIVAERKFERYLKNNVKQYEERQRLEKVERQIQSLRKQAKFASISSTIILTTILHSKLYGGELKYETLKQGFDTISGPEKALRVIEFLKGVNCKIDNNGPVIITSLAFDYILKQLSNVVRMDKIPFVGAYMPGLVGVYVERSYLDGLITYIGNVNRLYPGITFIRKYVRDQKYVL